MTISAHKVAGLIHSSPVTMVVTTRTNTLHLMVMIAHVALLAVVVMTTHVVLVKIRRSIIRNLIANLVMSHRHHLRLAPHLPPAITASVIRRRRKRRLL